MYTSLSIKISSGKVYLFQFKAAPLVFILGNLSNLPGKASVRISGNLVSIRLLALV